MKLKIKVLQVLFVTILLSGLMFFSAGLPVAAAPAKSVMVLSYEVKTNLQGDVYLVLKAKLNREDGYPLSERNISFFESTDLFGPGRLSLGSAITTAVGIAELRYETRVTGEHMFTVVYSGDENTESSVVNATLDLQGIPDLGPLERPVGLEKINSWTMLGVGFLVLAIWGLLAIVSLSTIVGIRRGSKG